MPNCHFNDLRAKALTDKEAAEGMQQARHMGAHSTEAQTADYVRHRKAQRDGGGAMTETQPSQRPMITAPSRNVRAWERYVGRFTEEDFLSLIHI